MTDDSAAILVAELLFLQSQDPKKEISFYINSPGGAVTARSGDIRYYEDPHLSGGDLLYRTGCLDGRSPSMSAGTAGRRFALENSRIMIHQPSGRGLRRCSGYYYPDEGDFQAEGDPLRNFGEAHWEDCQSD